MGVLLAMRVAEILSGKSVSELVEASVFRPLKMERSAQGLGRFRRDEMVEVQVEFAAPEAGGGDPSARDWDWNSLWWRKLGAPWGGTHSSAPDIARFLADFLNESGAAVKPETARLMVGNQNPAGLTPRGLGFKVGREVGGNGSSEKCFGHSGSTGTYAWAEPANHTICVILTSLPDRGAKPHPRSLAADAVVAGTA
jgi:CubicO group peptidase (beta-lactamase class C family)